MGFLKEDFNEGSKKVCQEAEDTRERKGALEKPIRVIASEGLKVTFKVTAPEVATAMYVKRLEQMAQDLGATATISGTTVTYECPNMDIVKIITKVWK